MSKKLIPVALAPILLLGACGGGSKEILKTDSGKVTENDIINVIGKGKVAQVAFQKAVLDVFKDKYKDKLDYKKFEKDFDKQVTAMGGKEVLERQLAQSGMSFDQYKMGQAIGKYQEFLLKDAVKVTDADVKDQVRKASHILIKVKSDADPTGLPDKKAKAKAEELLKKIRKNPSLFADIAKKESQDQGSASKGGDIGYVVKGQTDKEFEKSLFALTPGELDKSLTKSQFGYHIIKSDKMDVQKDKAEIDRLIRNVKVKNDQDILTKAYTDMLNKANIKFSDDDVKTYVNKEILKTDKKK